MEELKCPNCGQVFTVDESGYAQILQQVRDREFDKEVRRREQDLIEKKNSELTLASLRQEKAHEEALAQKDGEIADRDKEISRLYVTSTTIVVVISLLVALPLITFFLKWLYETLIALKMTGWIPFYLGKDVYPIMLGLGLAAYIIVMLMEFRKIKKIPKDEALKNAE